MVVLLQNRQPASATAQQQAFLSVDGMANHSPPSTSTQQGDAR